MGKGGRKGVGSMSVNEIVRRPARVGAPVLHLAIGCVSLLSPFLRCSRLIMRQIDSTNHQSRSSECGCLPKFSSGCVKELRCRVAESHYKKIVRSPLLDHQRLTK